MSGLLLLSESHRLLDRPGQLLLQRVVRLVRRQIQPVEARVTLRQRRLVLCLFDREASRAVAALQVLESVHGDTRGTRGELQKTRLLFRVPSANQLR